MRWQMRTPLIGLQPSIYRINLMRNKTLLIGIDGLLLDRGLASGRAPFLSHMKMNGFFTNMRIDSITISGPSWSTLLTGAHNHEHQVKDNDFLGHQLHRYPDFLTQASEIDSSLTTFAAGGWLPLLDPNSAAPIIRPRVTDQSAGKHHIFFRDGDSYGYEIIDAEVAQVALQHIADHGPDLNFVYFSQVDEFGHKFGSLNPPYFQALARVDRLVAQLHGAIEFRVNAHREKWLVVITTDHGHLDEGGHGGDTDQERSSFVIAHGIGRSNPNWPATIYQHELASLLIDSVAAR